MNVEPLSRLADLIASPGEPADVYAAAVDAVRQVLGADRAAILLRGDDGAIELGAGQALSGEHRRRAARDWPWPSGAVAPAVVIAPDLRAASPSPQGREALLAEGIRAVAFVPLSSRHGVRGALGAYFDAPRALSDDEVRAAETIAHHVTLALDRARAGPAEAGRTDFLSALGHTVRNPLNAIVNAAQVIEAPTASEAAKALAHDIVRREIAYLGRLLERLLDEARLRRGLVELRLEKVDLRSAVRLAVAALSHKSAAKAQELLVLLPEHPVAITGDADRLRQIVGILLDNAIRLTPARGSICVELALEGDGATIRVRDSGIGIPADRLSAIFEPFIRVAHEATRSGGGLGLGLSLVKRIVELHGGTVWAESEGPDKGAEFIARIPVAPPDRRAPRSDPAGTP